MKGCKCIMKDNSCIPNRVLVHCFNSEISAFTPNDALNRKN